MVVRAVIIAVLVGIIGGEILLDVMFPMPAAAQQTCCEGWKPCPDRKKIRQHGHTYTWYCGPDATDGGTPSVRADAKKSHAAK